MRHVIRVQAKEIVRSILKEEKAKNEATQNSSTNNLTNQLDALTKKLTDISVENSRNSARSPADDLP